MRIRYVKILLVVVAALQALIIGLTKLANLESAKAAVAEMFAPKVGALSGILGSVTDAGAVSAITWTIIILEVGAGALALIGAVRMTMSHDGTVAAFEASKRIALVALGVMLLTWLGLFQTIGGALFQMGQSDVGRAILADNFLFAMTSGLVLLIVAQPEPPHADRDPHDRRLREAKGDLAR
ncbi:DUF2165 family protein [Sphingomicrobium clamense]|uniref:DUF2165 domain-containing protein n=1 Tax=Sphingomicrobium clamense TaxID=2851013 RepID=A0ABS6V668_9SPHN|nr:DUF2165 family protein [Sphingomicrobium sp. B8]MBW0144682.1 DUF2165 domain-containing protein [Sphingomicrobium sp. B8]